MATQTTTSLVDDIDGTKAAETVSFALDGQGYEIDLSKANAKALRDALAGFVQSARTVRNVRPGRANGRKRGPDASVVREWAAQNGYEVSERGRVPAEILDAYREAQ